MLVGRLRVVAVDNAAPHLLRSRPWEVSALRAQRPGAGIRSLGKWTCPLPAAAFGAGVGEQTAVTRAGERPPQPPPQLPPPARLLSCIAGRSVIATAKDTAGLEAWSSGDVAAAEGMSAAIVKRRNAVGSIPQALLRLCCCAGSEVGKPLVDHGCPAATVGVEADGIEHVGPGSTGALREQLQVRVEALPDTGQEPNRQRAHGHDRST